MTRNEVLVRKLEEKGLELERLNRELAEREARLRAIFDAEPECVKLLADDGSLLDMNPAGLRMLEADSFQQVANQCIYPLIIDEHRPAFRDLTERVFRGESGTLEFQIVGLKGTRRWLETHANPLRNERGEPTALIGITRDITERKRAEVALQESEKRYRTLVEWTPEPTCVARGGKLIYVNPAAIEMFGATSAQDLVGQLVLDRVHPDFHQSALARLKSITGRGVRRPTLEERLLKLDGTAMDVEVQGTSIVYDGAPAIYVTMRDVTERKQAADRIRQLNRIYAVLSDINQLIAREREPQTILDGACRIAVENGGFLLAWVGMTNAPAGRLTLTAHAGATTDTLEVLDHVLGDPTLGCAFTSHALETGDHAVCNDIEHDPQAAPWREAALQRGYRSMVSLALTVTGHRVGTFNLYAGEAGFFDADELHLLDDLAVDIAFALDVCERDRERQRAQEELRISEERYRTLTEISPVGIWQRTLEGKTLFMNPAVWAILEINSTEEMQNKTYKEFVTAESVVTVQREHAKRRQGIASSYELEIIGQRGGRHHVAVSGAPLHGPDGAVQSIVGTLMDITARRTAEEELRRREERFRSLIEHAADMIGVINHQGIIRFLSPSAEHILGYPTKDVIGRSSLDFVHPDDVPHTTAALQEAVANPGTAVSVEYRVRHRDRQWRTLQTIGRSSPDQAVDGFIVLNSRDITDSRRIEEQLRQSQKMEAVGQLAGGIAHDFNNLLTVINGTADLALSNLNAGDPLCADLSQIRDAGHRAASLTRQLLAFSRKQIMMPDVLDLNAVVSDMQRMLQRLIGEDIAFVFKAAESLASVRADPSQIEQVVMNMVVNARDAMSNGGVLTIETQNVILDAAFAAEHPSVEPGPHVMLAVTDTGIGMDGPTCKKIFEPFFTTKGPAQNTGLGLSMVYGIVKQSGGSIWVSSEPGRGTTFAVYLPQVERAAHQVRPVRTDMAVRGTETILIVEDEAAVRHLATRILQTAGYAGVTASHGAEALSLLERHDGPVHLLFTDVVMPGMTGRDLATRLANIRPRMKVLYTSGYTDDAILRHGVSDDADSFLEKPYTRAALTRKVRDVLDSPDSSR